MTDLRSTYSRLDPILFSSDRLKEHSWLKPMDHYVRVRNSSQDESERRRALFLGLLSGLKAYKYPWEDYTTDVPAQTIFEELGLTIYAMPDDIQGAAMVNSEFSEALVGPGTRSKPRGTEISLTHELYHEVSPYPHRLKKTVESADKRPAAEILASRFAYEVTWPMPVITKMSTERSVDQSLPLLWDNLYDLIRVTSRPVFLFQYDSRQIGKPDKGSRITSVSQLIVGAPEHYGDSIEDLRRVASHPGDEGASRSNWRPSPVGSSMLTREGLFYKFDGTALNQWLAENELIFIAASPSRPGAVTHTKELPCAHIEEVGCVIPGGQYFICHFPEGDSAYRVLAVSDDDGLLADAWSRASRRWQRGPLLPWVDPMRRRQPQMYEEWLSYLEAQFLDQGSSQRCE